MNYPIDFCEELRKKPICGVIAVCFLTGVTFERATHAIIANMLPHQKRHGGRTYSEQVVGAARECGANLVEVPTSRQTLQRWVREQACSSKTYLVKTSGHFVVVNNGLVADQYCISPVEIKSTKRCFVREVYEVII